MKENHKLQFFPYTKERFLSLLSSLRDGEPSPNQDQHPRQILYLESYLAELGAKTVLWEPRYFDRDYLAEFAAFYSVSSKGYVNICERLHFFADDIGRRTLITAAGEGRAAEKAIKRLQNAYLGFIVKRPIPAAPLGRTVLRWFPDRHAETTPRVTNPSRRYFVHVAGVELSVDGLAWQQQDTGVGACATISLWSMFHSSAFDSNHAVPTTAEITRDAHKRHSFGTRIFPSKGLNILQMYEAINERNLVPLITEGDVKNQSGHTIGFSRDRFSSTCASFLRSGYPVLIIGRLEIVGASGEHAICNVGFRSCPPAIGDPSRPDLSDSNIEILYVHDDNLGPNVRVRVLTETVPIESQGSEPLEVVSLRPEAPPFDDGAAPPTSPTDDYGKVVPTQLIVAAHSDIRTDPDTLHKAALKHVTNIADALNHIAEAWRVEKVALSVSARFIKIADYLGEELQARLGGSSKELAAVRLALCEKVDPMSLHIGVVRIGLDDATVLADILYDTTDSDRNHPVFVHVAYNQIAATVIQTLQRAGKGEYGVCVTGY